MALELERILQGLDLPLKTVPDNSINERVTIYDADGFKIVARLCRTRGAGDNRRRKRTRSHSGHASHRQ